MSPVAPAPSDDPVAHGDWNDDVRQVTPMTRPTLRQRLLRAVVGWAASRLEPLPDVRPSPQGDEADAPEQVPHSRSSGPAENARDVAKSMLKQRVNQAEAAGLLPPDGRDESAATEAASPALRSLKRRYKDRGDTGIGALYPVGVLAAVLLSFVAAYAICELVDAHFRVRLVVVSAAPILAVAFGIVRAAGLQRQRLIRETGIRFRDEIGAMPTDGRIALQRAENLAERAGIEGRVLTQRLLRDLFLAAAIAIPAVTLATFATLDRAQAVTVVGGCVFEILAFGGFATSRQRMRELEGDRRQADYERSLLVENATTEERAEKLFLRQQFELKRYYDETLRQSTALSYLGVVCVGSGLAVVGVAFYLVTTDLNKTQQIVIAALGASGGILANFVAIVFLRMHAATVTALTSFHERLVGTHHVHFANLLAARVNGELDKEQRSIVGSLALALSSAAAPEAGTPDAPGQETRPSRARLIPSFASRR